MVKNTNTLKPGTYLTESKVSAKDNKNKKGEVTSQSYSTVIPKPILTKLGLQKGQILYWDILEENKIIITPEINTVPTPEEASIEAGNDMLNDWLINDNGKYYINPFKTIKTVLTTPNEVQSMEDKVKKLVYNYNDIYNTPEEKEGFKKVVLYLLDYPLNIDNQFEILREVYDQITITEQLQNKTIPGANQYNNNPKELFNIGNEYTIRWNGRKTTFNLPEKPVRYWDSNIKIKFYHRGTRSHYSVYKSLMNGKFKKPREETQLYINGKYFIQLSWSTTEQNEKVITEMIQYLYIFGYDLPKIKDALKRAFYQR